MIGQAPTFEALRHALGRQAAHEDVVDLAPAGVAESRHVRVAYVEVAAEDERAERPNPSPVPIDGVLRTGLASLQQALKLYHSFLTEQSNVPAKAEHQALVDRLTRTEIDAAMRECDQLGLKPFLARGGFASPQVWVTDDGKEQSYPAKATVAPSWPNWYGAVRPSAAWRSTPSMASAAGLISTSRSSSRMATRVSRWLPLMSISRFTRVNLDRARPDRSRYWAGWSRRPGLESLEPGRSAGPACGSGPQIPTGMPHDRTGRDGQGETYRCCWLPPGRPGRLDPHRVSREAKFLNYTRDDNLTPPPRQTQPSTPEPPSQKEDRCRR